MKLSKQQKVILTALSQKPWLPSEAIHAAVFSVAYRVGERERVLSNSERASLSRSLKRLQKVELIEKMKGRAYVITAKGLTFVSNCPHTLTDSKG